MTIMSIDTSKVADTQHARRRRRPPKPNKVGAVADVGRRPPRPRHR